MRSFDGERGHENGARPARRPTKRSQQSCQPPSLDARGQDGSQRQSEKQAFTIPNMKKICRRKNEKEPYAPHRNIAGVIKLNKSSQQDRCDNASDTRDDERRSKITSTEISNKTNQPRKQRIKGDGAVLSAVTKFCDLLVIPEIPLVPYLKPLVWAWRVPIPKHGIALDSDQEEQDLDGEHPADDDPVLLWQQRNDSPQIY